MLACAARISAAVFSAFGVQRRRMAVDSLVTSFGPRLRIRALGRVGEGKVCAGT